MYETGACQDGMSSLQWIQLIVDPVNKRLCTRPIQSGGRACVLSAEGIRISRCAEKRPLPAAPRVSLPLADLPTTPENAYAAGAALAFVPAVDFLFFDQKLLDLAGCCAPPP